MGDPTATRKGAWPARTAGGKGGGRHLLGGKKQNGAHRCQAASNHAALTNGRAEDLKLAQGQQVRRSDLGSSRGVGTKVRGGICSGQKHFSRDWPNKSHYFGPFGNKGPTDSR